jgi:hypothetical protein
MPFSIRPYRRFPIQCAVTYNAGPFQGQGTVWNLSCSVWRLSDDRPMRPGGQNDHGAFLWTLNGHRAVCTVLRRGVDHAAGILMKGVACDGDGAPRGRERGAVNLTVLQRHGIRV